MNPVLNNKEGWAMVAHSGGRGRWTAVSLRPAWSTRASSRTGSKATEKHFLEKPKKQNKTKKPTKQKNPKTNNRKV